MFKAPVVRLSHEVTHQGRPRRSRTCSDPARAFSRVPPGLGGTWAPDHQRPAPSSRPVLVAREMSQKGRWRRGPRPGRGPGARLLEGQAFPGDTITMSRVTSLAVPGRSLLDIGSRDRGRRRPGSQEGRGTGETGRRGRKRKTLPILRMGAEDQAQFVRAPLGQ